MAKGLNIPKWRTLRIKVLTEKRNTEEELEFLTSDPTEWDSVPEYMARVRALDNVLTWMEQIKEALDD